MTGPLWWGLVWKKFFCFAAFTNASLLYILSWQLFYLCAEVCQQQNARDAFALGKKIWNTFLDKNAVSYCNRPYYPSAIDNQQGTPFPGLLGKLQAIKADSIQT